MDGFRLQTRKFHFGNGHKAALAAELYVARIPLAGGLHFSPYCPCIPVPSPHATATYESSLDDDLHRAPPGQSGDRRRRPGDAGQRGHEGRRRSRFAGWPTAKSSAVSPAPAPMPSRCWSDSRPSSRTIPSNVPRAATELAKEWRTDRALRRLEALLAVVDAKHTLLVTGTGDVIQPTDGVLGIGSGGNYAVAAARALVAHSSLSAARDRARSAGNRRRHRHLYEHATSRWRSLPCATLTPRADRRRARPPHRRPARRQAGRGDRHSQSLAAAATARRDAGRSRAQEHSDDRPDRRRQDRNRPAAGQAHRRAVHQGRSHEVHRSRLLRPRRGEHGPRAGRKRDRPGRASANARRSRPKPSGASRSGCSICSAPPPPSFDAAADGPDSPERHERTREKMRAMLAAGEMEEPQGRNHDRAKGRADDVHRHGHGAGRFRSAGHVREDPAQEHHAAAR